MTPLMGRKTRVDTEIYNDFKVKASFTCKEKTYVFNLQNWAKASDGNNAMKSSSNWNYFVHLLEERFGQLEEFGNSTLEILPDGGIHSTVVRSRQQILNILKYGTADVFKCVEEIVKKYPQDVTNYAIFHKEHGRQSTYEEIIHLLACDCIVQSNFIVHNPSIKFELVDFCTEEQEYNAKLCSW
jgi:hypothetical protein